MATAVYYDEEECLALPIFIAELELLVAAGGGGRGGRVTAKLDGVQLLELLQKLAATIPRTDRAVLKQYQRQVEATLYDILTHGSVGGAVSGRACRSVQISAAVGDPSMPAGTKHAQRRCGVLPSPYAPTLLRCTISARESTIIHCRQQQRLVRNRQLAKISL